jgi:hypothetical protein
MMVLNNCERRPPEPIIRLYKKSKKSKYEKDDLHCNGPGRVDSAHEF